MQYHHISNETPKATSISPALFRDHMQHLADAGYEVMALPDVVEALKTGKPLPPKAVAITFDDGYRSVYEEAFPILKRRAWPFTVFINAKPIDEGQSSQFVTWSELREMAKAGATIANHSYSHPHFLRRLDDESTSQWRSRIEQELARTQRRIEEELDQNHRLLAYPYGEYDQAVKQLVEEKSYVAFGQQSGPVGAHSDLQALPRFPFGGSYGAIDDFKVKAASLPMPLSGSRVLAADSNRALTDTVLPQSETRPRLVLEVEDEKLARRVQCFASGQGAIAVKVNGNRVVAQAGKDLPVGRSRYNCTAQSEQPGRFYWYSEVFIRKKPDGTWYEEA